MSKLITTQEASDALGISTERVRQLAKELDPAPQRFGRQFVFTPAELKKLESRKTQRGPKKKGKK